MLPDSSTLSYAFHYPTIWDGPLVDPDDADVVSEFIARLEADRRRVAAVTPLPYTDALEHCRAWILEKGATTRSAGVLESLLLSLANEGRMDLSDVRVLDTERRLWLVSLLLHIDQINNSEFLYAAGSAYAEGK